MASELTQLTSYSINQFQAGLILRVAECSANINSTVQSRLGHGWAAGAGAAVLWGCCLSGLLWGQLLQEVSLFRGSPRHTGTPGALPAGTGAGFGRAVWRRVTHCAGR